MDKLLEDLIRTYKLHLEAGDRNLDELKALKKINSCEYKMQLGFNSFWKLTIKDFQSIADMYQHEHKNDKKKH